jgi:transposase
MIDYEMFCKIHDHRTRQGLSIVQTAQALGLHTQTVSKWSRIEQYRRRPQPQRGSRLDPYKGQIVRWLDTHPYSAQQIFQRVREAGFTGGLTTVKKYVRQIRPPKQKAFLKLSFAVGEAAQVDWGLCRSRHSPHYAESRTTPSIFRKPLVWCGIDRNSVGIV